MIKLKIIDFTGNEFIVIGKPQGSLLNFALENGVNIQNACRAGACGACMATILSGGEYLIQDLLSERVLDIGENEFLTCIGGVRPDIVISDKIYDIEIRLNE